MNALAHPISVLTTEDIVAPVEAQAMDAIRRLAWAIDQLLVAGSSRDGISAAIEGVRLAGTVLDRSRVGIHHKVAHLLGGGPRRRPCVAARRAVARTPSISSRSNVAAPHSRRRWARPIRQRISTTC
jgi:hypothetical protein